MRTEYALREKRGLGVPLQRVRVIEHVRRNKWKVEWIDPNPGLVDYVESAQLIVPWKEHKALLKEEANAERLRAHNEQHGYDRDDSPIAEALQQIFESVGDRIDFDKGSVVGMPEAIARVRARAGITAGQESVVAYADRQGRLHLPFDVAFELGRRFCGAEPSTVLVGVESTERDWTRKAERGEDYIVNLLNQYRASWALIRQWAGHDAVIAQKAAEIQRLERLVWDAVYALQKAGLDSEAARLRRAVERH
ncbi:MAG: hypothetical protein ABSB35_13105 [Bryobacteraceae bacterium]